MPSRSSTTVKLLRTPFASRTRPNLATRITERPRPARKLESELGEARYNCGCGFVFEAPVLTSVACPHCGDAQAW